MRFGVPGASVAVVQNGDVVYLNGFGVREADSTLAVDPDTMFIGVEQGGLLKSTDAGSTFQVVPGMDDDVELAIAADPETLVAYLSGADVAFVAEGDRELLERLRDVFPFRAPIAA